MISDKGKCDYGYELGLMEAKLADYGICPASTDSIEKHFGAALNYILFLDNAGMMGKKETVEKALMIFDRYHKLKIDVIKGNSGFYDMIDVYKVAKDVAEKEGLKAHKEKL